MSGKTINKLNIKKGKIPSTNPLFSDCTEISPSKTSSGQERFKELAIVALIRSEMLLQWSLELYLTFMPRQTSTKFPLQDRQADILLVFDSQLGYISRSSRHYNCRAGPCRFMGEQIISFFF